MEIFTYKPFFSIPEEVHNDVIAALLPHRTLQQLLLVCHEFHRRRLYGLGATHYLPFVEARHGLHRGVFGWAGRGHKFWNIRKFKGIPNALSMQERVVMAMPLDKLTTVVLNQAHFEVSVADVQALVRIVALVKDTVKNLSIPSHPDFEAACTMTFPRMEKLTLQFHEAQPWKSRLTLPVAPRLRILKCEDHTYSMFESHFVPGPQPALSNTAPLFSVESIKSLEQYPKLERLYLRQKFPRSGFPKAAMDAEKFKSLVRKLKKILPVSANLRVSLLRAHPMHQFKATSLPKRFSLAAIAVEYRTDCELLDFLISEGYDRKTRWKPDVETPLRTALSTAEEGARLGPLKALVSDAKYHCSVFETKFLEAAAVAKDYARKVVFTQDVLDRSALISGIDDLDCLATYFTSPRIKRCNLLTATLSNAWISPTDAVHFLTEYSMSKLLRIDARKCSVFHGPPRFTADLLQYLFFDARANPNLVDDSGATVLQILAENYDPTYLGDFLKVFKPKTLVQEEVFTDPAFRTSLALRLIPLGRNYTPEIVKTLARGLDVLDVVVALDAQAQLALTDSARLTTVLGDALTVLDTKNLKTPMDVTFFDAKKLEWKAFAESLQQPKQKEIAMKIFAIISQYNKSYY